MAVALYGWVLPGRGFCFTTCTCVCIPLQVQVGAFAIETKKLVTVSWCQTRWKFLKGNWAARVTPPLPLFRTPQLLYTL